MSDVSVRATRQAVEEARLARQRSFRRPQRTVDATRATKDGLGGRHLGFGLTLSSGFIALFLLWRFAMQWDSYPTPVPTLAAWIILLLATVATLVLLQRPESRAWLRRSGRPSRAG